MYGGIYLGSTKNDDSTIEPCDSLSSVTEDNITMTDEIAMTGEITMVNKKMTDFLNCKKCGRKIDGVNDGATLSVFCANCDADVKLSKCRRSRAIKLEFEEETTDVLDKVLNVSSADIAQGELRKMMLELPKVSISHSKNIIQSIVIPK